MVSGKASPRPWSVTAALVLITSAYAAIAVFFALGQVSDAWSAGAGEPSRWLMLALVLLLWVLLGVLTIGGLAVGRRWAWWGWLLLFALEIPALWSGLRPSLEQGGLRAASHLLLIALTTGVVVLLLLPASRRWCGFGGERAAASPAPAGESPRES
jgi:hypothetical protein